MLYSSLISNHVSLVMKKGSLEKKTNRLLRSLAAEAGIAGRGRMTKSQLVSALAGQKKPRPAAPARRKGNRKSKLAAAKPARAHERGIHPTVSLRKNSMRSKTAAAGTASGNTRSTYRESTELPASYGRTQLTLMEVDPHRVHAFWEVTPADREAAMKRLNSGNEGAPWVLRLYEIAPAGSESPRAPRYFDVSVDLAPGNWYVQVPPNGCAYRAELGPISDAGRFEPACRSHAVQVPRPGLSARFHPRWLDVNEDSGNIRSVAEPPSDAALPSRYAATIPAGAARPVKLRKASAPAIRAIPEEPFDAAESGAECREAEDQAPHEYAEVEIRRAGRHRETVENISSFSWNTAGEESPKADRAAKHAPRRSS
jgi:hypothetical protein